MTLLAKEGDVRTIRLLDEEDGWKVVAIERWVDPYNRVEEVALMPDPFVTSRQLRKAVSSLTKWRNEIRDKQGPVLGIEASADGPATTHLMEIFINPRGWYSPRRVAKEMNSDLERLREVNAAEAERWCDELRIPEDERWHPDGCLTPKTVENVIARWRRRWRNWE
jgi:hypothetical protein